MFEVVTPAKVTNGNAEPGVQDKSLQWHWIPAFAPKEIPLGYAGMTATSNFIWSHH